MNVSEKIRYYRELRGLTQQQLADFSGIPLGTLKKYETGNRNPKQEPLQRIADALHISITSFQDIHLETIGEVAPYLFAISKVGKVQFHGNKDADGKFDLNTLTISFDSPVLKHFLKEWADSKVIIDHLRDEAQFSPDETTNAHTKCKKIRSLIGSSLIYSLHCPQTASILQAQSPETFDL